MIILGLGSNLNHPLNYLRQALQKIKMLPHLTVKRVSPVYISDALLPENAPPDWNKPYLNAAIAVQTTDSPLDLLKKLKNIEQCIGRQPSSRRWAPRLIDIDLLASSTQSFQHEILQLPHQHLLERPFALWPLTDIAPFLTINGKTAAEWAEKWGSRFSGKAPFQTRQIYQRIDTPQLVGIINVTPDSFSDGKLFLNVDRAIAQAAHLIQAGATVLDIGAESTAPTSVEINEKTEWDRLQPILESLNTVKTSLLIRPMISIDTRHPIIAEKALDYDIDWINDVSGLENAQMRKIVIDSKKTCVIMHHLHLPERRQITLPRKTNGVQLVYQWGQNRLNDLIHYGIPREKIIFDPGIGFGKLAEQSIAILHHIKRFKSLNVPLLIGHSRKSYLSLITSASASERDIETTAVSLQLANAVDYLRIHNVEMCARAFNATYSIK